MKQFLEELIMQNDSDKKLANVKSWLCEQAGHIDQAVEMLEHGANTIAKEELRLLSESMRCVAKACEPPRE